MSNVRPAFIALAFSALCGCKESAKTNDKRTTVVASTPSTGADAVPSADAVVESAPLPASSMRLTAGSDVVEPGACVYVELDALSSDGYLANVAAELTAKLASDSATGQFFADSACATALSPASVTIIAGTQQNTLYYKDSAAGAHKLTATEATSNGFAASDVTATNTAVTQLAFADLPNATTADCNFIVLFAAEAASTPVALAKDATISLTASTATGAFYSDDACTEKVTSTLIPAGESEGNIVYFKDTAAGSPVLTASADAQTWTKASKTAVVAAPSGT